MAAARGDTKPCTKSPCAGTMQFGRRGDNVAPATTVANRMGAPDVAMETRGWVCSVQASHFLREE